MTVIGWAVKDPEEKFPIEFDWSARLPAGDTITASAWTATPALATSPATSLIEDASPAPSIPGDQLTRAWLRIGGTVGRFYVTNTISTLQGRVLERTLGVLMRQQ